MSWSPAVALRAELSVTLLLTGLIWTIQVVHYPLMAAVGRREFPEFEAAHVRRITFLVAPLMICELLLAASAPLLQGAASGPLLAWIGLALVGLVWLVTLTSSVPCHQRLAAGFDPAVHRRLVRTNWLRTAAWSSRAGLLLAQV